MKHIWTILLMLALAQASFGQLSGSLSGTLGPGTYHVVGTISIDSSDSLRLMPGTTFIFDGPYPFNIYGTLLAEGMGSDSIMFTTDIVTNPNRWRGLRFWGSGSSGSRLAYCLVEKGLSYQGGGMYCYDSASPSFTNCRISGNSADFGGGVQCQWYSSPTFANCTVTANSGGGVCCWSNSSPSFTNCTIGDNWGGGAYCLDHSSPSFTNCTINGNSANQGGGVFCSENCSPIFTNCILSDNHAAHTGGGACCMSNSSPSFTNCTLRGNSAYSYGGGVVSYNQASPSFVNCILWVNTPEQIFLNYGGSALVTYSDVQDGWPGTGNIDADPRFVSGPDGPYYLSQIIAGQGVQSPCVDAGDFSSPVIEGTTRTDGVQDTWPVDMGYHYQAVSPSPLGFVELIQPGPTDWGYRLHWVSGSLSRLAFTNFCSGTIGSVGGNAEAAGWTVANYSDSIVFTTSTPLTSGSIDTFWLSHPYCSDVVTWTAGDSSGTIEGPLPVEMTTFQAIAGDGQVTLRWRTESELDNDHFILYKREAGEEDFRMLAEIPGHGTTTEPHDYTYVDRFVQTDIAYEYRISDVDITGRETIHEQIVSATPTRAAVPLDFALHPNYPNPFNPTTTIRYDVKETGLVSLKVFDLLGREVVTLFDGETSAGSHTVIWDAGGLPSGVYLCRMEAERFVETRKLMLLK
ncbi:MAG: right-handed parallel beta-helix repeat-containing protein [bacterium]